MNFFKTLTVYLAHESNPLSFDGTVYQMYADDSQSHFDYTWECKIYNSCFQMPQDSHDHDHSHYYFFSDSFKYDSEQDTIIDDRR